MVTNLWVKFSLDRSKGTPRKKKPIYARDLYVGFQRLRGSFLPHSRGIWEPHLNKIKGAQEGGCAVHFIPISDTVALLSLAAELRRLFRCAPPPLQVPCLPLNPLCSRAHTSDHERNRIKRGGVADGPEKKTHTWNFKVAYSPCDRRRVYYKEK